jgi:hypothetical protein
MQLSGVVQASRALGFACEELCECRWAASPRMSGAAPQAWVCWLSRATRSRQCIVPGKAGRDALTGTIGARRAWTVSMISALSMPCR